MDYFYALKQRKMSTYRAVIASLSMDSIEATLTNDGIQVSLITQKGVIKESKLYTYTSITSINLFPIDINRHQATIRFDGGESLKLVSRSFGMQKLDGTLKRDNIDQMDTFKMWLNELHDMIAKNHPINGIVFATGSTGKVILLSALAIFVFVAIFLALNIGAYGAMATLISGLVVIVALLLKLGAKKTYNPTALPEPYRI
jgi:hypothetical protein